MYTTTKRTGRVGDLLQEEISSMLIREEIKDPRIGMVTITGVKVSTDLRHAIVYFSTLGGAEEKNKSLKGLNSAARFIQRELGKRIRIKFIPQIKFIIDDSLEKGAEVDKLLKQIKESDG